MTSGLTFWATATPCFYLPASRSRYDTRSPALAVLVEVGLAERLTHPLSQ